MTEDQTRIRILSVDDHPLLREGIAAVIASQPDMVLAGQACDGHEAILQYRGCLPDVTLMDLRLPDITGVDAIIAIRAEFPDARIIVLSTFEGDMDIQRALEAGAAGYMVKDTPPSELIAGIRQVHSGRRCIPPSVAARLAEHIGSEVLTPREVEVLALVAEGYKNAEIAGCLFISEETVKVHVKHVMEKLGASDRTRAVSIALRRGIVTLKP